MPKTLDLAILELTDDRQTDKPIALTLVHVCGVPKMAKVWGAEKFVCLCVCYTLWVNAMNL